jgi:phytoene dehydrogenase-like protein
MSKPFINAFFGIDLDLATAPNCNFFAIPTWDDASSLLSLAKMDRTLLGGKGHSSSEAWATQVAARQPMFVQSSSRRDPSHSAAAPTGHATVEVQSIVPYNPTLWGVRGYDIAGHQYRNAATYQNVKSILLDGMAQRMEQAFPGSAANIIITELGTPATQERYVGNSNGAPFGLDVSPTQSGPFRPGVTTSIRGLYLAGTSTAWGPATEGAMLSGRRAASAVVGRDLSAEVRNGAILTDPTKLNPWPADFDVLRRASAAVDKH